MDRQYQTDNITELAAGVAKAESEITHAAKDLENEAFKRNGKASTYAGLPSVFDAARPFLAKNGLSVVQMTDFDDAGNVTLMTQMTHATGQWMRSWYPVRPTKNDPQGLGSAITYARRFAYCSMVGVAAVDEDDDGDAASGTDLLPRSKGNVTDEQADKIGLLITEAKANKAAFLSIFKVDEVGKIPASRFDEAIAKLKNKKKQNEETAKAENANG